jgi:hypothetical protein
VENYFNYFTEIEEHFLRRRGGGLLLTTLDWALIETWKESGIPLEAALRGIDTAFDRYDQRARKTRKINGLGWCSQAVLNAAEDMKEAAVGASSEETSSEETSSRPGMAQSFEPESVASFLRRNAELVSACKLPEAAGISMRSVAEHTALTLLNLAQDVEFKKSSRLEDVERHLTVLEEKLFAALLATAPDEEIVAVRAEADRELSPYRRKMAAPQIEQLLKQYIHKQLLEKYGLPRLSLFYM